MKKITSILLMLFVATNTIAQLQEEGFGSSSSIPAGWTSTNTSSCDWVYNYTGEMPQSGGDPPGVKATFPSGAALFDDATCSGGNSEDRAVLEGPTVNISTVTNVEIEVVYNLQVWGDRGKFIIEVFDGSSWQEVFMQDVDTPRNTGLNQTVTVDVSTHINSNFKVRLIYDDEGTSPAYGLGIDNYKLTDTSVAGVEDLAIFGFNYGPNPVSSILKLNSKEDIKEISVYNVIGQQVRHVEPLESTYRLDLNSLPVGAYIVHVRIDSKLGSFKILKN